MALRQDTTTTVHEKKIVRFVSPPVCERESRRSILAEITGRTKVHRINDEGITYKSYIYPGYKRRMMQDLGDLLDVSGPIFQAFFDLDWEEQPYGQPTSNTPADDEGSEKQDGSESFQEPPVTSTNAANTPASTTGMTSPNLPKARGPDKAPKGDAPQDGVTYPTLPTTSTPAPDPDPDSAAAAPQQPQDLFVVDVTGDPSLQAD